MAPDVPPANESLTSLLEAALRLAQLTEQEVSLALEHSERAIQEFESAKAQTQAEANERKRELTQTRTQMQPLLEARAKLQAMQRDLKRHDAQIHEVESRLQQGQELIRSLQEELKGIDRVLSEDAARRRRQGKPDRERELADVQQEREEMNRQRKLLSLRRPKDAPLKLAEIDRGLKALADREAGLKALAERERQRETLGETKAQTERSVKTDQKKLLALQKRRRDLQSTWKALEGSEPKLKERLAPLEAKARDLETELRQLKAEVRRQEGKQASHRRQARRLILASGLLTRLVKAVESAVNVASAPERSVRPITEAWLLECRRLRALRRVEGLGSEEALRYKLLTAMRAAGRQGGARALVTTLAMARLCWSCQAAVDRLRWLSPYWRGL